MPDPPDLARAVAALERGDLVVIPTDTVYGVAARPDVAGGTRRLFEAKRRPSDLALPVLVTDLRQAEAVAAFDRRARALARRYWPGPLTLVLPRAGPASGWDLGFEASTIGIRMPAHRVATALLGITGPLAVTSANRSGDPTPPDCDGVRAALGDAVAVYMCAGRCAGAPSTVVDLVGAEPEIRRLGAIDPRELRAVLRTRAAPSHEGPGRAGRR